MDLARPRTAGLLQAAAVVVLVAQVVVVVLAAWAPPDLFDQGIYLSSARFVADGLVPYRDFGYPYGPGLSYLDAVLVWTGLDTLPAHRLLWGAGALVISVLVLRLAHRAGRLQLGVLVGALLLVAPIRPTYVVPVICVLGALLVLQRDASRMVAAAVWLALAAWFRFDYLLLLALFLLVWLAVAAGSRLRVVVTGAVVSLLAFAPYLVLAALGAAPGMRATLDYALHGFGRYRDLPYPFSSPVRAARLLVSGDLPSAVDQAVRALGYLVVPVVVVALVAVAMVRGRRGGGSVRRALDHPAAWLAVVFFAFAFVSLRVRSDAFHAAPLLLAGGLVILCVGLGAWQGLAATRGVTLAVAAVLAALAVARGVIELYAGDPLVEEAVEQAREYVAPGDPLFVADVDNSITYINAPYFYWALEARPASAVTTFDPGYADQDAVQEDIVDDLCRSTPVVLLWDAPVGGEVAGLQFSDELDTFLADSYETVWSNAEFRILEHRGAGC